MADPDERLTILTPRVRDGLGLSDAADTRSRWAPEHAANLSAKLAVGGWDFPWIAMRLARNANRPRDFAAFKGPYPGNWWSAA